MNIFLIVSLMTRLIKENEEKWTVKMQNYHLPSAVGFGFVLADFVSFSFWRAINSENQGT